MRNAADRFWVLTLIRGGVAVMTGCFVLITTDMDRTLLLVPVGVAMGVTSLALYGILDSLLILLGSVAFSAQRPKRAMQVQGAAGILWGAILLFVLFEHAALEWFLPLAVLQALSTAVGEIVLLKDTRMRRWAVWDLAGAFVATCFGVIYTFMRFYTYRPLSPAELATAVYLYLLLFGAAQIVIAVRMLKNAHTTKTATADATLPA